MKFGSIMLLLIRSASLVRNAQAYLYSDIKNLPVFLKTIGTVKMKLFFP